MRVIKNILGHIYFFAGMLLFVVTMLIVFIPIWIISLLPEPACSKALHVVFKGWMSFFMTLVGCPILRKGKHHFKKGTNYVVVVNHNSFVDVPVSSPWIPGANKTLAKAEMASIPLFGLIYKTGSILVDRKKKDSRADSFIKMQQVLELGMHLCLYPEGTRNKGTEPLQPFQDGAFIAAIRAQKPIMPGVIFNTGKILPHNKKFWARPMPIRFHFLEPISTEGMTPDDTAKLKERVYNVMKNYYVTHNNT